MTYSVQGLDPAPYLHLFDAPQSALDDETARRVVAANDTGFPCRVSLEDARSGEELILVHHVSNDVSGPFRMAHAIYIRRNATRAEAMHNVLPAMIERRTVGLRAFDRDGMLIAARLALPGQCDADVRALLDDDKTAYIHAHNAAFGCFLAGIERD